MKVESNGRTVFELKGESLAAARRLESEIVRELQSVTPKTTGYLNEIQASWDKFYDGLVKRLEVEAPELLAATGLASPAVQVTHAKDAHPRAYREFPAIFQGDGDPPRYFMYAPTDYKGDHFRPKDGIQLTRDQEEKVDDLLFAGGWLGNAPLVTMKRVGVATPVDYDPLKNHFHRRAQKDRHTQRIFIAAGESLKAVNDFERRKSEYEAAMQAVQHAIKTIAEMDAPQLNIPEGEGVNIGVGYSYGGYLNGKTQFILSARLDGKADIWNAGKTVAMHSNDAYTLHPRHGGEYTVEPRRDTYAGKKLASLMDAVPKTPELADYPQLLADFTFYPNRFEAAFGIGGKVPFMRKIGGNTILVYNVEDTDTGDFTPPGALPLPLKAYKWMEADEQDRNMGVTPPPMPSEVRQLPWNFPFKGKDGGSLVP